MRGPTTLTRGSTRSPGDRKGSSGGPSRSTDGSTGSSEARRALWKSDEVVEGLEEVVGASDEVSGRLDEVVGRPDEVSERLGGVVGWSEEVSGGSTSSSDGP
jgi:hypothetical protein